MPSQRSWIGFPVGARWFGYFRSVKGIVVAAVLKLFTYSAAHLEAVFGGDRYIAGIEKAVYVPPEEQTIVGSVLASFAVGSDMRSVERR